MTKEEFMRKFTSTNTYHVGAFERELGKTEIFFLISVDDTVTLADALRTALKHLEDNNL